MSNKEIYSFKKLYHILTNTAQFSFSPFCNVHIKRLVSLIEWPTEIKYIYIYMRARVCECVCVCILALIHIWFNNIDILCLHIFVFIFSSRCIDVMISGGNWFINLPWLIDSFVLSARSWAIIRGVYAANAMWLLHVHYYFVSIII